MVVLITSKIHQHITQTTIQEWVKTVILKTREVILALWVWVTENPTYTFFLVPFLLAFTFLLGVFVVFPTAILPAYINSCKNLK